MGNMNQPQCACVSVDDDELLASADAAESALVKEGSFAATSGVVFFRRGGSCFTAGFNVTVTGLVLGLVRILIKVDAAVKRMHSLHCERLEPWTHFFLAKPQSLHLERRRPCSQIPAPPQSLHW